jgi:hypothetical protein
MYTPKERALMSKVIAATVAMSGLLLLSGTSHVSAAAATPAGTPTVNESMTKVMSIHAQTIWDITSHAFNARGDGLVGAKISTKDWYELAKAGQALRDRATLLANARNVYVAGPGEMVLGEEAAGEPAKIGHAWDALNSGQIQARIQADPAFFAKRARILAQAGATVVKASQTRDVRALYGVSSGLDEVCDGCHQKFWGTDDPPPFPKSAK